MSSRIRSGGCSGPRDRRTWIWRTPKSRSCSIGPSNWLPPNRSSPPRLVLSKLSSAATDVSKGTSTIRQNDSDPSTGTMLVLMASAPPAPRGAWFFLGSWEPCLVPHTLKVRRKPLPPHRTNALSSVSPDGLGAVNPHGADLSRLSPGQDGRSRHGRSAGSKPRRPGRSGSCRREAARVTRIRWVASAGPHPAAPQSGPTPEHLTPTLSRPGHPHHVPHPSQPGILWVILWARMCGVQPGRRPWWSPAHRHRLPASSQCPHPKGRNPDER